MSRPAYEIYTCRGESEREREKGVKNTSCTEIMSSGRPYFIELSIKIIRKGVIN